MPIYRNPNTRPLSGYCLPWVAELANGERVFCDTRDGAREVIARHAKPRSYYAFYTSRGFDVVIVFNSILDRTHWILSECNKAQAISAREAKQRLGNRSAITPRGWYLLVEKGSLDV